MNKVRFGYNKINEDGKIRLAIVRDVWHPVHGFPVHSHVEILTETGEWDRRQEGFTYAPDDGIVFNPECPHQRLILSEDDEDDSEDNSPVD